MPTAQLEQLRVAPGEPARLAERDPRDTLGLEKEEAEKQTKKLRERIDELQYLLFAEAKRAVLSASGCRSESTIHRSAGSSAPATST
jgi:hypothetical protein